MGSAAGTASGEWRVWLVAATMGAKDAMRRRRVHLVGRRLTCEVGDDARDDAAIPRVNLVDHLAGCHEQRAPCLHGRMATLRENCATAAANRMKFHGSCMSSATHRVQTTACCGLAVLPLSWRVHDARDRERHLERAGLRGMPLPDNNALDPYLHPGQTYTPMGARRSTAVQARCLAACTLRPLPVLRGPKN